MSIVNTLRYDVLHIFKHFKYKHQIFLMGNSLYEFLNTEKKSKKIGILYIFINNQCAMCLHILIEILHKI